MRKARLIEAFHAVLHPHVDVLSFHPLILFNFNLDLIQVVLFFFILFLFDLMEFFGEKAIGVSKLFVLFGHYFAGGTVLYGMLHLLDVPGKLFDFFLHFIGEVSIRAKRAFFLQGDCLVENFVLVLQPIHFIRKLISQLFVL